MTLPILVLPFLIAAFVGTHVVVHQQDEASAPKPSPANERAELLKQSGFDLSKRHVRMYNGRAVIVMGALEGDTTAAQFWLDREHFTVVRIINPHEAIRLKR